MTDVTTESQRRSHFGRPRWMNHLRSAVQDQPGQHGETPSLPKIQKLARRLRQEHHLNLGDGGCSELRLRLYTPACCKPKLLLLPTLSSGPFLSLLPHSGQDGIVGSFSDHQLRVEPSVEQGTEEHLVQETNKGYGAEWKAVSPFQKEQGRWRFLEVSECWSRRKGLLHRTVAFSSGNSLCQTAQHGGGWGSKLSHLSFLSSDLPLVPSLVEPRTQWEVRGHRTE
ncbi:hypothetical protein AAY473_006052 [Plecturocebus cupreus]